MRNAGVKHYNYQQMGDKYLHDKINIFSFTVSDYKTTWHFFCSTSEEDTILHAITNALSVLPSLESMGICYTPQLKSINPVPAVKYKWYMNLRENPR